MGIFMSKMNLGKRFVAGLMGVMLAASLVVSPIPGNAMKAEAAISGGKAYLAVIAKDSTAGTKKKFENHCRYYEVPYIEFGEKEKLGHSIGKDQRSILAVTNESLAGAVLKSKQGGK